jgi:Amt family ammonium transporter
MVEMIRIKKVTMLGVASGLVGGLVGITPAAGFVEPMSAIAIGALAGTVCYGGVLLKGKFGYDDALDAFGVHGVGGALGAVLTGVFATAALDPGKIGGLIEGKTEVFVAQLIGIGAAALYSVVVTVGILFVLKKTMGLRVDAETEHEGLDSTLHGEAAYALGGNSGGAHSTPVEERVESHASKPSSALQNA